MQASNRFTLARSSLKPLAACVAAIFSLSAPAAMAATWTVNSCSETSIGVGNTGTLRYAVAKAASDDTIDMTGLTCSTISLTTGAITIAQDSLTLNGPGMDRLTITGKLNATTEDDRIINHTGNGSLDISNLSVSYGFLYKSSETAAGGCIYSAGGVFLMHVGIHNCLAGTTNGQATFGGGVYAKRALSLKYSIVENNIANSGTVGLALGGGALTLGSFIAEYSTISGNKVKGNPGHGGGLFLYGETTVRNSTLSANYSSTGSGAICIRNPNARNFTASIVNSTISGNSSGSTIGGLYTNFGNVSIKSSTIVFNTAALGRTGPSAPFEYYSPGLAFNAFQGPIAVTLQSSLIANNTYVSGTNLLEDDLSIANAGSNAVTFNAAPANNLVRATSAAVPSDTIVQTCPLLGPLRDNGGLTQTHALLSHSPGIGQGNNTATLDYDQRGKASINGTMNYPRISTGETVPDIGAYEIQQGDIVFNSSFDGCPLLE